MRQMTKPSEASSHATRTPPPQQPRLRRWLAGAFLTLWWVFIGALLYGVAQYIGNHAGPTFIPLLPHVLDWVRKQVLFVQIALGLLVLVVLALMVWMTYLAWRHRQWVVAEETEAEAVRLRESFEGSLGNVVTPRLDKIQGGVQQIDEQGTQILDIAVVIQEDVKKLSRSVPLPLVCDLKRDLFKMGDPFAENFPYLTTPIQALEEIFAEAEESLTMAAARPETGSADNLVVREGDKCGIVIVGEANGGKSRLAFEALTSTLASWSALLWSEARTTVEIPAEEMLHHHDVVIVLDDLHNYTHNYVQMAGATPTPSTLVSLTPTTTNMASGPEAVLRELLRIVRKAARRTIVVATCRSEYKRATEAELTWLLTQLVELDMPLFSEDVYDQQSSDILKYFRKHGAKNADKEWDGTLGSAVLGLGEKRAEYQMLVEQRHQAVPVLRAMKLMRLAGIASHTERRIRRVCADVFEERALLTNNREWQLAVDKLLDLNFVRVIAAEGNDAEAALGIRADTYFDYVVAKYPDERIPGHLEQGRAKLLKVFESLHDAPALFALGITLYNLKRYKDALLAYNQALEIDQEDVSSWYNKGIVLYDLGHYEDALQAYDRALNVDPTLAFAWYNKGIVLTHLKRYEDALSAYDQSLTIDPKDASAWTNKGIALRNLGRYEDALLAYDQALATDANDVRAWYNKGYTWYMLKRYEDALAMYDHALTLDAEPERSQGWNGKAYVLAAMGRYEDALTSINRAIDFAPDDANVYDSKGEILKMMHRYEEACEPLECAVALNPGFISSWKHLTVIYHELGREDKAQKAERRVRELGG